MNSGRKKLAVYHMFFVVFLLSFVSSVSAYSFLTTGMSLLYGDAVSRLNISRKIVDNLTPGLAQLGNIWLPLPQVLMLPFIWNNYLWHSGIAGTLVSMTAFVIGGLYIYGSIRILTKSLASSFFGVCVYALNINLLYFQTTAMSEMLFICSLCAGIYYFVKWIETKNRMYLMPAGMAVSATTLVRYEGLAILFASIPMVAIFSWFSTKKFSKSESNTIFYATLACLGFTLWTIYLTAIFGDPLYWKNYYAGASKVVKGSVDEKTFANNLSFIAASWKYMTAVVWMNGLITTVLAIIAVPILLIRSLKNKSYYFLPVFLSASIFLFMVMTIQRNTPIGQPDLTLKNILSPETYRWTEFNIRYGLLMLPTIALLCSYLFNVKYRLVKVVVALLFLFQVSTYFSHTYSLIYQIPLSITKNGLRKDMRSPAAKWMNAHYDGGLIMISALKHDPDMFRMGYNYRTYIHEGAGMYWKLSRANPQRYAKWIIMDVNNAGDQVTKYLKDSPRLQYYNVVFTSGTTKIYKIKTKPDFEVKI